MLRVFRGSSTEGGLTTKYTKYTKLREARAVNLKELRRIVARGEDSRTQFKLDVRSPEGLASEVVAFLNSKGGTIFIGVSDAGGLVGLSSEDVRRINQLVSNVASQSVRDPVSLITENIAVGRSKVVVAVHVDEGNDKPYFDGKGVVWLKEGSDKRRVVSKDEIRRLFEASSSLHADEQSTKVTVADIDIKRLSEFFAKTYGVAFPKRTAERKRMLKNMNLADDHGFLNLAGLLMFGKHPEFAVPQFGIKAVRFSGVSIGSTSYLDSEEYGGRLDDIYKGAKAFVMRNLHKRQGPGGVNMPGVSEIPEAAIEELLVNALLHRDYFVSAPIRVLMFDDRVEIVSPGSLPNHLTVEKILAGNTNIRNPILATFVAKGLLPYHGLGSGIMRVKEVCPGVSFIDDKDGVQFKAILPRRNDSSEAEETAFEGSKRSPLKSTQKSIQKSIQKTAREVIKIVAMDPYISTSDIAAQLGLTRVAVARQIRVLKENHILARVGPDKGGHWEIVDTK